MKSEKEFVDVKLDCKLAEFIGIYLGDGYLGPSSYEISIVGNGQIDNYYMTKFIPKLMKYLFSKKPNILYSKFNCGVKCYIYSKAIFNFLVKNYGLYSGRKINPKIPSKIFNNKSLLRSCIRGLVDTDGGVHKHHISSIQLKFDNKEYTLIYSLKCALECLGFNPRISRKQKRNMFTLYLFGQQVDKYFKEIGSNNLKNKIKFRAWKQDGIVPINNEVLKILKIVH